MTERADHLAEAPPEAPLRPADRVMRLARLGSFHQSRLSFMRALMRRMKRDEWHFDRPVWRIDAAGVGHAVYRARGPARSYSLVCFSHDLDPAQRSDRVIAEAWDATFTLFDGEPTAADIERLSANVPKQEAGRCSERELVLSRANRSVRLFEHVVERLAAGHQPDPEEVEAVGYLMRTTAVYGNGKFGLSDRDRVADRDELKGPFRAEMLAVYLIRAFTVDLAEHLAAARAPETAVRLEPAMRRHFGVGNSTGLGMAPFLVTHPLLLHSWIHARETALARVRALETATAESEAAFRDALARARRQVAGWQTVDARQRQRTDGLATDLDRLAAHLETNPLDGSRPWDALIRWSEPRLDLEAQEMLVSLVLEPHGWLVDDLASAMYAEEEAHFRIDGSVTCRSMREMLEKHYGWALTTDFRRSEETALFWYVSEEKLEPRLGWRDREPGVEREQPLAVGRDIAGLHEALRAFDGEDSLAAFLVRHPDYRHAVRRVRIMAGHPYAEIRDNLISADLLPIDLLRCKLSFFGATRFDPRSDRWVRITMYQDAPLPDELPEMPADDWALPLLPANDGTGDA